MRSRYRVVEPQAAQFVTSTVVGWLPVFTTETRCKIITDSLEYCRMHRGLKIHAWVILDNHFHAIVAAPDRALEHRRTARHGVERDGGDDDFLWERRFQSVALFLPADRVDPTSGGAHGAER